MSLNLLFITLGLVGAVLAFLCVYFWQRKKILEEEVQQLRFSLTVQQSLLEAEKRASLVLKDGMGDQFKSLAAEIMQGSQASFFQLAEQHFMQNQKLMEEKQKSHQSLIEGIIKPTSETLKDFKDLVQKIEQDRARTLGGLNQQIMTMMEQTHKLSQVLSKPQARGQWGEFQLKRVVEMAGMLEYVDFVQQEKQDNNSRPDMTIRLPNSKVIFLDSKVPLDAFYRAVESQDPLIQKDMLRQHALAVRQRLNDLSKKSYFEQNKAQSPEFVVLFLPGENLFQAALMEDPALIEDGTQQRVLLVTPTSLIALLKAVAYGWQQQDVEKKAQAVAEAGAELYERFKVMAGHFQKLGGAIEDAGEAYTQTLKSFQSRILPSMRKLGQKGQDLSLGAEIEPKALDERAKALDYND